MSPTNPDAPGALRQAMTKSGLLLQTVISWTPPTLALPKNQLTVLIVLEARPDKIHEGWWSDRHQAFSLTVQQPDNDGWTIKPREVRYWAYATVNQQPLNQ